MNDAALYHHPSHSPTFTWTQADPHAATSNLMQQPHQLDSTCPSAGSWFSASASTYDPVVTSRADTLDYTITSSWFH
ncbi:hypothetical protein XELAEV_18041604mg [Xenopus laevis]|uniref:Uncharacterized protein n=1 Tax=Xenopus laevis TaxID=8355 RepID=A0A974C2H0_XENLA|nr:hypothetical protein XELAEV_18041604mg [Xenopus laevis]